MKNLIKRNLEGKKIILLFILTGILYSIMLTITIPKVMHFSQGMKLLDMMPTGYNTGYVSSLLNTLGEQGRDAYLYCQIPFDLVYPLLFGISFCLILAYFLKKLEKLESYLINICILPLMAGFFDYFENFGIIIMLKLYPEISKTWVQITNIFSILKSSITTISFILLIVLLIVFVYRKLVLTNRMNK